jgi:ribosome biogenesis protein MAK21
VKRDPEFAGAKSSCVWELNQLGQHFHPSVVKFSTAVLSGADVPYGGDPLKDFTTMAFLDRFSFKNPKKNPTEPAAPRRIRSASKAVSALLPPVNSREFLQKYAKKGADAVPAHERFFHTYFTAKAEREAKAAGVSSDAADRPFDPRSGADDIDSFADRVIRQEMARIAGADGEDDEMPDLSDMSVRCSAVCAVNLSAPLSPRRQC